MFSSSHTVSRLGLTLVASVALTCLGNSCSGDDAPLLVNLFTDLSPGQEFSRIRTQVSSRPISEASDISEETVGARPSDDFSSTVRVANFLGVPSGTTHVRVTLFGDTGTEVLRRDVVFDLSGTFTLLVVMTRECLGIDCPLALDDPAQTTCVAGECVAPDCGPSNPEACPAGCSSADDCPTSPACADSLCVQGQCIFSAHNDRCEAGLYCNADRGCIPRVDVPDGGVCAETETSCDDALDDDCDGLLDCADPDCVSETCSDGSVCTESDACNAAGVCVGTAIVCADENACTNDSCDPETGCAFNNNTTACDNGNACDGPDACAGGACSPVDPSVCECTMNEDCGAASNGDWTACGGFVGACGTSGTRSRPVMTPRCNGGACAVDVSTETEPCTRVTAGNSCGTVSDGDWGACGGFANACDTSGTRTRTRTTPVCRSGSCRNETAPRTGNCTRTVGAGTVCGATAFHVCCGATCVDTRNNANHCGGCNTSCASQGRNCVAAGGGYTCDCAASNAQCTAIYTSGATCWTALAPDQCQCACPVDRTVCPDAGCGAGSFCHDCAGGNFCAPFGGSC